ncbi:hypothetical protein KF913_07680 [Candidatus Obscuribacterales bacterium]|nr:hypothetical protein [Candidatus Obscuribacterales bacterium]
MVANESHNEKLLNAIVKRMVEKHGCHTVFLYGSRATDNFEPNSDFDICGFRDEDTAICDCVVLTADEINSAGEVSITDKSSRAQEVSVTDKTSTAPKSSVTDKTGGALLDAWIYPVSLALQPDESLLRLRSSRILIQKDDLGERCLENVEKLFLRGPLPLPDWEKQKRQLWMKKTLGRVRRNDLEGRYRALWLLHSALEYYFELRGKWYCGSKASFKWLEEHDREFLGQFETALANPLDHDALASVIEGVTP